MKTLRYLTQNQIRYEIRLTTLLDFPTPVSGRVQVVDSGCQSPGWRRRRPADAPKAAAFWRQSRRLSQELRDNFAAKSRMLGQRAQGERNVDGCWGAKPQHRRPERRRRVGRRQNPGRAWRVEAVRRHAGPERCRPAPQAR